MWLTVDVIDVNKRIPLDRSSNSLVPSRVEDGRAEIVHTSGIRISLGLSAEDGAVEDDPGDVVQDVGLDLDEVGLAKDDNLDRLSGVSSRVFQVLDFGDDPDQVDVRHSFTHERRHDTKTTDLDLQLPVDDFVFQSGDQDLATLVGNFGPSNHLAGVRFGIGKLLRHRGPVSLFLGSKDSADSTEDGEVGLLWLGTVLVVLDAVERPFEDETGEDSGEEWDGEKHGVHGGADPRLSARLKTPAEISIVDDQGPGEVRPRWSRHVEVVRRDRVGRKAFHDTISVRVSVEVVVVGEHVDLDVRGPIGHDLQLPLAVLAMIELVGQALVEAPLVVRTTSDELGNTTRKVVAIVGVNDGGSRSGEGAPV